MRGGTVLAEPTGMSGGTVLAKPTGMRGGTVLVEPTGMRGGTVFAGDASMADMLISGADSMSLTTCLAFCAISDEFCDDDTPSDLFLIP